VIDVADENNAELRRNAGCWIVGRCAIGNF